MKSRRGFIEPLLLVLVAVLLIGGGAYWYVQKQSNRATTLPSSDLKTYTNSQYGFEFKYPAAWSMVEVTDLITLTPPSGKASEIRFMITPLQKGKLYNIDCPSASGESVPDSIVNTFHEEECKNLTNTNGVKYARGINAGISTEQTYKERTLAGYFLNSEKSIAIGAGTLLTDATGVTSPSMAQIFNEILDSFKFTNQTTLTSQTKPSSPDVNQLTQIVAPTKYQGCPYFYKDANHVYIQGTQSEMGSSAPLTRQVLEQADPSSFAVLNQSEGLSEYDCTNYSRDATHVFYGSKIIPDADPATFKGFGLLNMAHDNKAVYYTTTQIPLRGNLTRMLTIGDSYAYQFYLLDDEDVYYFGENEYGLDNSGVYVYHKILGANANSFHLATTTQKIDAKDDIHSYRLGNIVP